MRKTEEYRIWKRKNGYYYVCLPGWKNWKSTGERNEKAAHRYINTILNGEMLKQEKEISFGRYARDFFTPGKSHWLRTQAGLGKKHSDHTIKGRASQLKVHLMPRFENIKLKDITPGMIEKWLITRKLSGQTKNHLLITLSIILSEAQKDGYVQQNPAALCSRPKIVRKQRDALTVKELALLFPWDEAKFKENWPNEQYGVMMAVMASGGLRTNEARALTLGAIDFERKGVYVVQAVGSAGEITLPKANEVRAVPLPSRTMDMISSYLNRAGILRKEEFIFPGKLPGKPLDRKTPGDWFHYAIEKAEIITEGRWITPHSLRHTYNTIMREILRKEALSGLWDDKIAGISGLSKSDEILRRLTGHRSDKMTNLYDHPDLVKNLSLTGDKFRDQFDVFWN